MRIRQATKDNLEAVIGVIADGKAALAAQGLDQWQGGNPTPQTIEEDIAGGHTWVAVAEQSDTAREAPCSDMACASRLAPGAILGAIAYFEAGEADYDNVTEGAWLTDSANRPEAGAVTYAVLHRLAVGARARRRGVASALLQAGVERARKRGLASVRVDTHEGNLPMQHGFEKCGFVRCCAIEITNPGEITKRRIGFELLLG